MYYNNLHTDIKVLFVEDNNKAREEFLPFLTKYFSDIDIAKNGKEGIEKASKNSYDLIVTDVVMPEIDGIEMIKQIKSIDSETKFIVITAYSNKEFLTTLIELGIQGYLMKPITFKQVAHTIKKVTDEIYTKRRLIQQMEEIKSLAKVKSEFLANMSHEIRTPLNAILGLIKMMKDEDDGKFKKYLDIIDSSGKTLLTVINDILDISKIEAGKMNIEHTTFNSDEIAYVVELFEEKAKERDIKFTKKLENIPKYLNSDINRIKQVLSNLLSNAIKFTPENGNIDITIEYKKGMLYAEVKDNGIGIPENKLNTIFDAFNQADTSTTRKYGGTGLGLTISYKLIKMLNGELKVESKEGKGSCFYFKIPIKKGDKGENKIENNNTIKEETKILLAEDNPANQMFMKVLFKKLNINYEIANNGKEVVEKYKQGGFNLILMDINMPIMGGVEATEIIREIDKQIPIIALTASILDDEKKIYKKVGMNEALAKPLDVKKLKEVFQKYLK